MTPILEINKDVKFDEPSHIYTKNEKRLTSVTTVLGLFKNKFDPQGHIARAVAKRDGLSVEQVLSNWNDTKIEGLERGKNFHRQAEHFIKTGEILDEDYKDVITELSKYPLKGKLFSEIPVHSETYSIAGTCDLICLSGKNSVEILDFKTNKKITTKSKYGNKMLSPIEHLDESDLVVYSLQLWIYGIILEEYGYKIKSNPTILYINPETRKIDVYKTLSIKKDAQKLLNYYKKMQQW